MATYNSSSATSSYPLPHAENPLNVDVARLRSALEIADAQVAARLPIASYTAADVMVKVKSLDGPGSGLDADTLDGIHAAGFAAASHTHADATTGTAGFMTAADKTKMDGIGAGANVISVNAKTGALTLNYSDVGASPSSHTHADATSGAAGFMAAADKTKLDGINAQTYIAAGTPYNSGSQVAGVSVNASVAANPNNFYEVRGSGGAAALGFHRPGVFGAFFGLDSDNAWKVGGWSYGANSYKLWHEGNDGPGSGLDADTLDGLQATAFAAAVHTHTGGQIPVVKSIQKCLVEFLGSGTYNVAISSVNTATSIIVMTCNNAGGVYVEAYIQTATNVVANATGAALLRFQVVEFY